MFLESSDLEKKITTLEENLNNNKKSEFGKEILNKNRVWKQKIPGYYNNIILDINRYLQKIKQSNSLLDVKRDKKNNKRNINKFEEIKKSNSDIKPEIKIPKKQPEKFSKYIKNIYNKLKEIKNGSKEIILKDNKSLKNLSINISRTPMAKILVENKKEKKIRPTSASTYYDSKLFDLNFNKTSRNRKIKNKQWSYISFRQGSKIKLAETKNKILEDLKHVNLNKIIKRNEKKGNIEKLNDIYRLKINREIKKYTPKGHLKDIKEIQIEDVNMRKTINDINDRIKKRIKIRCGGYYFKKKYEKYISKKKSDKLILDSKSTDSFKSIDNKNILKRRSFSTRNTSNQKLFLKKEDNTTDKVNFAQKKESLKNILDLLRTSLDIEPIHSYINDKARFRNRHRNELNKDKEKYFSQFGIINKKFKELIGEKGKELEIEKNMENIIKAKEKLSKDIEHNISHKYIYE